jgi:hypothetical protein
MPPSSRSTTSKCVEVIAAMGEFVVALRSAAETLQTYRKI